VKTSHILLKGYHLAITVENCYILGSSI